MKRNTIRAYNLAELLIVLVIIAMMAVILFPIFATAKEKDKADVCLSNEKQLGLALLQYGQDYDHRLPSGTVDWAKTIFGQGWGGQLYPYIKKAGPFTCPADTQQPTCAGCTEVSYGLNGFASANPLRLFHEPNQTVELFEDRAASTDDGQTGTVLTNTAETGSVYGSVSTDTHWMFFSNGPQSAGGCCAGNLATGVFAGPNKAATGASQVGDANNVPRHSAGANYVMLDGHVSFAASANVGDGCVLVGGSTHTADAGCAGTATYPAASLFFNPDGLGL